MKLQSLSYEAYYSKPQGSATFADAEKGLRVTKQLTEEQVARIEQVIREMFDEVCRDVEKGMEQARMDLLAIEHKPANDDDIPF